MSYAGFWECMVEENALSSASGGRKSMSRPVTLAMTGDVMLGRGVDETLRRLGPTYPWGDLVPLLTEADLTILNLECVIAQGGQPWSRWPKVYHFRADPVAMRALEHAGVDCVTLANNHVLDYEEEALFEMLELLQKAGIAFTGAGHNLGEAQRPALLDAHGLRVGIVAFTDNEPGWAARPDAPGTNYIPITLEERAFSPVREAIAQSRAAGADLVIFTIHWGPNMVERPTPLFREFARGVVDAGADVFFGHSAHNFQGIELYKGRPIIYDAGDFVDDYVVDPALRNDWGLLFRLEAQGSVVRRLELIPVVIQQRQVNRATGSERTAIADRITRLSAELGTAILHQRDRLWVEYPAPIPGKREAGAGPGDNR
jgi:poly-gamma-glutamate synthesis protein (capsule biosynthesis protein)